MAEFGTVSIGFAIKVSAITEVRIFPIRQPFVNRFDEHGDMFTLDRLPLESNLDFKKRIIDMSLHPGGPTYDGLVNNLSRELNAPRRPAMTVDLKTGSDGLPLVRNPHMEVLVDRISLRYNWTDHTSYDIDKDILFYDLGSEGYFLGNLINEINSSQYFIATIDPEMRANTLSTTLVRGTTYGKITDNTIKADQFTILNRKNILEGSIWFSDKTVFKTEVSTEPAAPGEFYVNYRQGWVKSYTASDGRGTCGYDYATFPCIVDASLICIYTLQDEEYVKKLFVQETLQSGEETNALPNTEGAEVIHQLFKECKVFWGE